MSLTSHLDNRSDPIRVWLEARFPDLGPTLKTLRASMPADVEERTIRPGAGVPPGTMGTAIDYRIRYHLAITPWERLIAADGAKMLLERYLNEFEPENPALWRNPATASGLRVSGLSSLDDYELAHLGPSAFFGALDQLIAEMQPVGRTLDAASEDRLDRVCAVLALYEEVFRTGRVWPTTPLASAPMAASADEVLAMIPRSWTDDIAAVCARVFAEVPLRGTAILNPTFALSRGVGGADADLVLDGCLIDIKCTVKPGLQQLWLLQLLGYLFLDSDDARHINGLGILLARQAVMARWPLGWLLDELTGSARPSLEAMRGEFAGVVATL
jgi:hypothetical protein